MRARGWSSFWTIVAAIAGVIGAAAAIYPLLGTDQQFAYLTLDEDLEDVRLYALSEPIILTGNWSIKRKQWLGSANASSNTTTPSLLLVEIKDRRVPAGERTTISFWWPALSRVSRCPLDKGDLELSVEFRSKHGLALARTTLPYCSQQSSTPTSETTPTADDTDRYWPKDWKSMGR